MTTLATVPGPGDHLARPSEDARRLDAANDILIGTVENGPWVLIKDPALRDLIGRYVADAAYEIADAAQLDEASAVALRLRGDKPLPTALTHAGATCD